MKYKHSIVIAYEPKQLAKVNTTGTLVMHFNIIDNIPNKYNLADLMDMYLCNEIEGQEIWGTYYQTNTIIYPVFYCKKPVGEVKLQMLGQSALIGQPWFPLDEWNINDQIYNFTSNVIPLND